MYSNTPSFAIENHIGNLFLFRVNPFNLFWNAKERELFMNKVFFLEKRLVVWDSRSFLSPKLTEKRYIYVHRGTRCAPLVILAHSMYKRRTVSIGHTWCEDVCIKFLFRMRKLHGICVGRLPAVYFFLYTTIASLNLLSFTAKTCHLESFSR